MSSGLSCSGLKSEGSLPGVIGVTWAAAPVASSTAIAARIAIVLPRIVYPLFRRFRRLARIEGRQTFYDRIAVRDAHVMHHRALPAAVTIRPQSHNEVFLVLSVE